MIYFIYGEDSYWSKKKMEEIIDRYKKVHKSVLNLIDEADDLWRIWEHNENQESVRVLIGDDFGVRTLIPVGMVCSQFQAGQLSGTVGVIGPSRLNYPYVIPMVRYVAKLINDIAS